jgi:hypothetical protein
VAVGVLLLVAAGLLVLFLLTRRSSPHPLPEQGVASIDDDSEFTQNTAESVHDSTTDELLLGDGVGQALFLRLV